MYYHKFLNPKVSFPANPYLSFSYKIQQSSLTNPKMFSFTLWFKLEDFGRSDRTR